MPKFVALGRILSNVPIFLHLDQKFAKKIKKIAQKVSDPARSLIFPWCSILLFRMARDNSKDKRIDDAQLVNFPIGGDVIPAIERMVMAHGNAIGCPFEYFLLPMLSVTAGISVNCVDSLKCRVDRAVDSDSMDCRVWP